MADPSPHPLPLSTTSPVAVGTRADTLAQLSREPFDLLVIGGGITGAGIAREGALAGLRVALVDRDDFASGTSSRSSRLVHGGVRYLEHGHIRLVFESSHERRVLLTLAPHLVRPLAFTWPVYRGARVPLWKMRAGLALYDALSLYRNRRHQALSPMDVHAHEPALDTNALVGGARYWDAATDDARLTLANVVAARELGAVAANHVAVVRAVHEGARLAGVVARDALSDSEFTIRARVIINATGPWSDATAALTGDAQPSHILGSAGAHIAVPRHRVGNNDAVTLVSPVDGRVMFVLPAQAHAIIGTTETPAHRGPDDIRATELDVSYLLRSVNACFPNANLQRDDVIAAWAGIRPLALARAGERSANTASREHAIAHRADGLLSVTGGKLTTYRVMAADVLQHARQEFERAGGRAPVAPPASLSETTVLPGGDIVSLHHAVHDARETVHDAAVAERLVMAHGSRWRNVWSYAQRDHALGVRLSDDLPYLTAEVAYAVEREQACTISDVLIRRTHIAFETRDHGRAIARRLSPLMSSLLGWSADTETRALAAYDADVVRLFGIDGPL